MPGEALRIAPQFASQFALRLALRLALLQVLFASHRLLPLPDSPALFFALPLPEVLWAGALLYRLRSATARPPLRGPRGTLRRPHRVLRTAETIALASLLALLFVYNGGEIFYRYFYLDHFAIRTDLALIPGLARMLFPSLAWPETLLAVVAYLALAALLAGVSSLLAKALMLGGGSAQKPQEPENTIAARLVDPKRTNTGKGLMAQRGLIVPMGPAFPMGLVLSGAVILLAFPDQTPSYRMVQEYLRPTPGAEATASAEPASPAGTAAAEAAAAAGTAAASPTPGIPPAVETAPEPTWAFPGIKDADVHIIVVESYGATLLEREEYRTQMLPLYGSLESDLSEKGYAVFSGIVDSPAFGGRSWLADATILTGTTISDQGSYDGFVAQGIGARLLELMGNAGYRRIYAAPGTRTAPEDWRRAYPFDAYVLRYDFGYEGPFISFGAMPDQFMLNYVADHGLAQGVKDFALYLLVSSHVPFEQIPKYAEDWRFPLNGAEIGEGDILRFDNNWLSGKELAQGYLAGIGYSLRSSVGYIADRLVSKDSGNPGDQNIALIIGDHQPRKPVSHGTADFGVPFHLIVPEALATDRLAEELAAWKAARGMVPAQAAGRRTMASMVQMLEAIFMGEP